MMGIIILSGLSFVIALILVYLDSKLNNTPKFEEEALKMLPGYNCAACGFGSCLGMAEAMLDDVNNYKKCRPMNAEQKREMDMFLRKNKKIETD